MNSTLVERPVEIRAEALAVDLDRSYQLPIRIRNRPQAQLAVNNQVNKMNLPAVLHYRDLKAPSNLAQIIQVVAMGASLVALFIAA